jgi:hypothetical protein
MATTIRAHFDGRFLVPDEPVNLPPHRPLTLRVEEAPAANAAPDMPPQKWLPLNLPVNAELARAIAEEPEFDIEES